MPGSGPGSTGPPGSDSPGSGSGFSPGPGSASPGSGFGSVFPGFGSGSGLPEADPDGSGSFDAPGLSPGADGVPETESAGLGSRPPAPGVATTVGRSVGGGCISTLSESRLSLTPGIWSQGALELPPTRAATSATA
ncbi:hypothetical protein EW053_17395 [Streptomyces sp. IB2014 016-6]|nr:hypothetical protein EW053_17395 [Streptomyces sp. IB2014 016-6]